DQAVGGLGLERGREAQCRQQGRIDGLRVGDGEQVHVVACRDGRVIDDGLDVVLGTVDGGGGGDDLLVEDVAADDDVAAGADRRAALDEATGRAAGDHD